MSSSASKSAAAAIVLNRNVALNLYEPEGPIQKKFEIKRGTR